MFVHEALDRQTHREAPTLPVMLVIGPGGCGKTTLLEDIARAQTGNAPTALLDIARDPDTTPTQFMFAVAKLMGEHVSGIGAARFPRLLTGIRTVALRPDGKDPAEQLETRLRARRWIHGSCVAAVADGAAKILPPTVPKPIVTEGAAPGGELAKVQGAGLAGQAAVPGQEPGEREPLGLGNAGWMAARAVDWVVVVIGHPRDLPRPGRLGQPLASARNEEPERKPHSPAAPGPRSACPMGIKSTRETPHTAE